MQWLAENLGTVIVLLTVALITLFAVRSVIKNRKKGGCSCGCGCNGCSMAESCHGARANKENAVDSVK